ncbi:hypothetical protein DRO60_00715 [Candidatus Bathyarchaeota archaeon]|nr:MAG: hypothetical protein DRO60_00715 [Candidatus Bathyarchaeota archaeon]
MLLLPVSGPVIDKAELREVSETGHEARGSGEARDESGRSGGVKTLLFAEAPGRRSWLLRAKAIPTTSGASMVSRARTTNSTRAGAWADRDQGHATWA